MMESTGADRGPLGAGPRLCLRVVAWITTELLLRNDMLDREWRGARWNIMRSSTNWAGAAWVLSTARDERLRRDVAIKMLSVAEGEAQRARILDEARAASALNHPGIVTVYDIGEAEGRAFIVMELVSGQSLQDALAGGALELRAVLRI